MASPSQKYRFNGLPIMSPENIEQLDEMLEDIYTYLTQSPFGTSDDAFDFSEIFTSPGVLYAQESDNDLAILSAGTVGAFLRQGTTDPEWSAITLPNTLAVGDLWYASTTAIMSRLADVATGNALISGGVNTAPAWGKIALTTHVSGTLPVTNGGTGTATAFTLGSVVFAGTSGVYDQDNTNFFWDNTNNRLGIGTSPSFTLHVLSTSFDSAKIERTGGGGDAGASLMIQGANGNYWRLTAQNSASFTNRFGLFYNTSAADTELISVHTNGSMSIGGVSTNPGAAGRLRTSDHILIGSTAPSSGTLGLIFGDGTALATMASNTAGLYGNDVSGTVKVHAIDEAGLAGEITTNAAALTSGRIALVTTGGQLTDDAGITYDAADNRINVDQVKFPATQASSSDVNTLDDYEEGTWTPVITFATPGDLSVAYTQQVGRYTKIGNRVTVQFLVAGTLTHTTAAGNASITGAPFTHVTATSSTDAAGGRWSGFNVAGYTDFGVSATTGSAVLNPTIMGPGVAIAALTVTDLPTGSAPIFNVTLTYETAT